ncbi:carboxypeptidase regulatory-like domain-containing protein [Rhodococcus sp. P-2]|uniref:carboxypeptidase-like regulatory domain-containing protein n=1 Tax=Rhodococcus sp. P-2 TaxID=2795031 RepID=UPI0019068B8D|nr:carboxypeptidase-like regulatory domain-containing protein [Rhodococcus sp. P-2]QQM21566.1 carboxypeptidase regulatory-like domain-containing protein [Rhodococcus sp. P-2]
MRTRLSEVWSKAVVVGLRPRAWRRGVRGIGVVVVTGALVVGAAALGVLPMQSDVRLAAEGEFTPAFTVGLTAIDGAPPFDPADGPGLDSGPSNGIVREGDPVTYVVDIGVRGTSLSDVVVQLQVPRGFTLPSLPDYCGVGSDIDEAGLLCLVGDLEADRFFTRTATMIAGKREDTDGLPTAVVVTADSGAVRVRSNDVTVRVSTGPGVCDPQGNSVDGQTVQEDPVVANGQISGLVTSGTTQTVAIIGIDQCGHATARTVTPFEGHFSFLGLLPGTYRVTVDGRAPVDVVLEPGAMAVDGLTF